MAKPILKTPDLTGRDAEKFLAMHNDNKLTPENEEIFKSCIHTYRKYKK